MKAVATPRRRVILRLCWDAERSAGEIHRGLGDVTFGAVSQHLRVLAQAGLVEQRAQGRKRFYRARKVALGPLRVWLEGMWATALDELKLRAEMEESRRGPRPQRRRRR
jgi:DNA-binding transcriptional ArsR family regulator